ncbi:hypothetical protein SY91_03594 [Burkholderia cenocepacia]|nr:hypothetical protein SY91_03594 [Burkholderia cenocepacia]
MRHILLGWLLAAVVSAAHAAAPAPAAASAASGAAPTLTPQEARQALNVLENPRDRAQVETTLRAIAAVGALSAPAVPASAAPAASGASAAAAPAALTSNGLASMLVRQGSRWATQIGNALQESLRSLLDIGSVGSWWHDKLVSADQRADLTRTLGILVAVLLPALVVEWLAKRLLRRALAAVAARRADTSQHTASDSAAPDAAPTPPPDTSTPPDTAAPDTAGATPHPRKAEATPAGTPRCCSGCRAHSSVSRCARCRYSCSSASRA